MINKNTKTYKAIKPIAADILTGKMLCIDPSTGSKSSRPGYAWYEKGQLKESGEIIVDIGANRSKRLYEISRTIREDFPVADILCVEYIPPVSYRGGMNNISIMALQKAIGAILAAHPYEHLLEIPAVSWRKAIDDNYIKTDEMDSIYIGRFVIAAAQKIIEDLKK